jgi:hypothetical protein
MLESLMEHASAPLQDALRYWLSLKPDPSKFPARSAIDPAAIPHLLSRIILLEIVAGPAPRLKVRLAGELVLQRVGKPLKGRWLDEELPDRVETLHRMLASVVQGNVIWRCGPTLLNPSKRYRHSESVVFPMAEDGVTVDHIFGVVHAREPCAEQLLSGDGRR